MPFTYIPWKFVELWLKNDYIAGYGGVHYEYQHLGGRWISVRSRPGTAM